MASFLVISTGGTIASRPGAEGLVPSLPGEELLEFVPGIERFGDITILDLLSKDSSNMSPEDWKMMTACLRSEERNYDGFLILHGTDTMAYSASALSFLLPGYSKPVILTGSMEPIGVPGSDAEGNIECAFAFLSALHGRGSRGVSISFHNRLIHGPRSQKILSHESMAFSSINYPHLGYGDGDRITLEHEPTLQDSYPVDVGGMELETSIFLVTLFPGFRSRHLFHLAEAAPKAIVLEALGLGGVPYLGENLLPAIEKFRDQDIPVVITTQCVYGGVDLSVYEVGRKTLELGVISGQDMTREAIITKLMTVIPGVAKGELESVLHCNFCDEIESPSCSGD
ncbi:MAG: asparaginase [Synergistaceae bacterium]|nr:asparaginase [Synergistota bacterium]NLM71868.1 asparaginase [Synergistaceae bacterium]